MSTTQHECSWCGSDRPMLKLDGNVFTGYRWCEGRWLPNRRGEFFCCVSHRRASNAALRRLMRTHA